MKDDHEKSAKVLAPLGTRELIKPAQLVSRGLGDLLRWSEDDSSSEVSANQSKSPKASKTKKRYSIVWQELGDGSDIGERFWVPDETGCLPFFVDGDNLTKLESRQPVPLSEFMLLKGLLYTWNTKPPLLSPISEESRLRLLDILMDGFRFGNLEKLILDVAYKVRTQSGNLVSYKILKNGSSIVPSSSKIKADMLMDIGTILPDSDSSDRRTLLESLSEGLKNIAVEEINPYAWEILLVAKLAALKMLGETQELKTFFDLQVARGVTNANLQRVATSVMNSRVLDAKTLFAWMKDILNSSANEAEQTQAQNNVEAYPSTPSVVDPTLDMPEEDEDDHPEFSETEIAQQLKDMAQYLDEVADQANNDKQWAAARANDPLYQHTTFEQRKANRLSVYEAFLRKGKDGIREHLDRVQVHPPLPLNSEPSADE